MVDALKFCHLSDSHLGFFQYNKEERAMDFGKALNDAFGKIAAEKPDFILYTGDLFNEPNPKPIALHQFISAFNDHIRPLNIPLVFSGGNHDVSLIRSQRAGGTIYHFLEKVIPYCYYVSDSYKIIESASKVPLVAIIGMRFQKHGIPDNLRAILEENKEKLDSLHGDIPLILMMHDYVSGMPVPPDVEIDDIVRARPFNYIGVGHYHKQYTMPRLHVFCPGATEHTSSNDWDAKPGFFSVSMTKANKWNPEARFLKLDGIREKRRKPIKFDNTPPADVITRLRAVMMENNIKGSINQFVLDGTVSGFVALGEEQFTQETDKMLKFDIVKNFTEAGAEPLAIEFNPDTIRKDFLREQWHIKDDAKLLTFDAILDKLKSVVKNSTEATYKDQLYEAIINLTLTKIQRKDPDFQPEGILQAPPLASGAPVGTDLPVPEKEKPKKIKPAKPRGTKKTARQTSLLKEGEPK